MISQRSSQDRSRFAICDTFTGQTVLSVSYYLTSLMLTVAGRGDRTFIVFAHEIPALMSWMGSKPNPQPSWSLVRASGHRLKLERVRDEDGDPAIQVTVSDPMFAVGYGQSAVLVDGGLLADAASWFSRESSRHAA